ncbi:MAG: hypothetical protein M1821_002905 [Bathelium mastoideum]|nr:MAG: hypothetical protein M1821_002905 [Bathelium mastoideum]
MGNNNFGNNNTHHQHANNNNQSQNNNNRNGGRNNHSGNGSGMKCHICGRAGHKAADCPNNSRNGNNRNNGGNNRVNRAQPFNKSKGQNGRATQDKWCMWCKANTHVTEQCRYPPTICDNCLKKGHQKEQCRDNNPNLPIERDANGYCNWCHAPWHAGRQCLDRQIEERQGHRPDHDQPMGDAPTRQTSEIIQSFIPPMPAAPLERPASQPANPLATMTSQAWGARIHAANQAQHDLHRRTCDTCASSSHRTTECASRQPCTACASPFHSRANCRDVTVAQAFLKPPVELWLPPSMQPEHAAAGSNGSTYCVYCNTLDHRTESCGDERAQARHLLNALRCGACGKRGHSETDCRNPAVQWGGPPTLCNLREQDWAAAWMAGWRPACSRCEYAMEVWDMWNGEADVAMGGCVQGKLFVPAHVCKESVVWWVKVEYEVG